MPSTIFNILAPIYDFFIPANSNEQFIELLKREQPKKVLEVGAGTGSTAQTVKKYCNHLWLLEPALNMLQKGQEKLQDVTWVHGFIEQLPFSEAAFDLIYAIDSLHHWDHQIKALKEIHRLLKQQGLLIIIDFDPNTKIGHFIRAIEKIVFMRSTFFSPLQLLQIQTSLGFKASDLFYLDNGSFLFSFRKTASSINAHPKKVLRK